MYEIIEKRIIPIIITSLSGSGRPMHNFRMNTSEPFRLEKGMFSTDQQLVIIKKNTDSTAEVMTTEKYKGRKIKVGETFCKVEGECIFKYDVKPKELLAKELGLEEVFTRPGVFEERLTGKLFEITRYGFTPLK